jgi:hypothetical protein
MNFNLILQVDIKVAPGSHADEESGKKKQAWSTSSEIVLFLYDLKDRKWLTKSVKIYFLEVNWFGALAD